MAAPARFSRRLARLPGAVTLFWHRPDHDCLAVRLADGAGELRTVGGDRQHRRVGGPAGLARAPIPFLATRAVRDLDERTVFGLRFLLEYRGRVPFARPHALASVRQDRVMGSVTE